MFVAWVCPEDFSDVTTRPLMIYVASTPNPLPDMPAHKQQRRPGTDVLTSPYMTFTPGSHLPYLLPKHLINKRGHYQVRYCPSAAYLGTKVDTLPWQVSTPGSGHTGQSWSRDLSILRCLPTHPLNCFVSMYFIHVGSGFLLVGCHFDGWYPLAGP